MQVPGKSISQQLRRALKDCRRSNYQISNETGIDQGTLSRFRNAKCGLSLPNIDTLCRYLGLRLTRRK